MIPVPSGVRVWIATGATDMRRGMNGLALQIQETLKRDPHAGDIFALASARIFLRSAGVQGELCLRDLAIARTSSISMVGSLQ